MACGVIFDVDGTLVDSVDIHAQAWQDAFAEFGHDVEFTKVRQQIGKGGDQLMPVFLTSHEIDAFGKRLESRRAEILKQRYLDKIKGFPRVRELVQRLQSDRVQVVLASSAKKDELQTYKKIAGIDDLISQETTSDDAEKSKPHPDIFHAAVQKLKGVARDDILVVGDSPYDMQAAGKAGLKSVGVLCGGFSEQELREAGSMEIYRDPADMLARYDQAPLARLHEFTGGDEMSDIYSTNGARGGARPAGGVGQSTTDQARQAAQTTADQAKKAAQTTAEQARQAAAGLASGVSEAASEVQSRAASLAGAVGEQAKSIGEAQKSNAADALENVAKAIHKTGSELHGQQDWAAQLIERGAAELSSLATSLRRNDMQGLIDNLGGLARRQPATFVGISMAAGFLLTRIGRLAVDSAADAGSGQAAQPSTGAPSATPPSLSPTMPASMTEALDGQR